MQIQRRGGRSGDDLELKQSLSLVVLFHPDLLTLVQREHVAFAQTTMVKTFSFWSENSWVQAPDQQ